MKFISWIKTEYRKYYNAVVIELTLEQRVNTYAATSTTVAAILFAQRRDAGKVLDLYYY